MAYTNPLPLDRPPRKFLVSFIADWLRCEATVFGYMRRLAVDARSPTFIGTGNRRILAHVGESSTITTKRDMPHLSRGRY